MDFEVVDAPIHYNFLFECIWIDVMMDIVSSEFRAILFPNWGEIVMIDQLDYYMLEIDVQSSVPFIRDSLK